MLATRPATNGAARPGTVTRLKRPAETLVEIEGDVASSAKIATPYGALTIEYIEVTPEQAQAWVAGSKMNRPPRKKHVDKIARAMQAGLFVFNGETIILDEHGLLLDGQHRCLACIEASKSFDTLVVRGMPRDVFDSIDQGSIRTSADSLSIRGIDNAKAVASVLRYIGAWRAGYGPWVLGLYLATPHEAAELHSTTPHIEEHVAVGKKVVAAIGGGSAFYAFMHWLLSHKSQRQADEFFEKLATGAGLNAGDPVLLLRNEIVAQQKKRAKSNVTADTYAMFVNAWNAMRRGRPLQRLKGTYNGQVPAIE